MKDNDIHWLQQFISKNAWGILAILVTVGFLYASTIGRVTALENEITSMRDIVAGINDNQTQILLIQQKQLDVDDDIEEIKIDIREIKDRL